MFIFLNFPKNGAMSLVFFPSSGDSPHIVYQWGIGAVFQMLFNGTIDLAERTRSDFTGDIFPVTSSVHVSQEEEYFNLFIEKIATCANKSSLVETVQNDNSLTTELLNIYNDIAAYFFGYLSIETMLMASEPYNKEFHRPQNIYLATQNITETTATAYLQSMHQIYSSPTICDIEVPVGYDMIGRLIDDDGHPLDWNALVHQKALFPVFSLYRIAVLDLWAAMTLGQLSGQKICPYCGRLFTTQNPDRQVYCSAVCKSRYHETKNWPFRTGHDTVGEFSRNVVNADYCKKAEKLIQKLETCDKLPGQKLRTYACAYHEKPDARFLLKRKNVLLGVIKKLPAYPFYLDISEARGAWMQLDKVVKARDRFKAEADALRQQACDAESDRLKGHIASMEEDAKNGFYGPWHYEEERNPIHRKELSALWADIKKEEDVR